VTEPDSSPRSTSTETQVTWGTPAVAPGPLPRVGGEGSQTPRRGAPLPPDQFAIAEEVARLGEELRALHRQLEERLGGLATSTSRAIEQLATDVHGSVRDLRPLVAGVSGDMANLRLAMESLRSQQAEQFQRTQARADVATTAVAELTTSVEAIAEVKASIEALAALRDSVGTIAEVKEAVAPLAGLATTVTGLREQVDTAVAGLGERVDTSSTEARAEVEKVEQSVQAIASVLDAVAVTVRDVRVDAQARNEVVDELRRAMAEQPVLVAEAVRALLARSADAQTQERRTELDGLRSALATDQRELLEAVQARIDENAAAAADAATNAAVAGRVHSEELRSALLAQHVDLADAVRTALTDGFARAEDRDDQHAQLLQAALLDQQALFVDVVRSAVRERDEEMATVLRGELEQAAAATEGAQQHLRESLRAGLQEVQVGLGEVLRDSLVDQAHRLAEATAATAAAGREDAEALRVALFEQQADLAEAVRRVLDDAATARAEELTDLRAALLGQYAATGTVIREVLTELAEVDRSERSGDLQDLRAELLDNQAALAGAVRDMLDTAGQAEEQRRTDALGRLLEALTERQRSELDRLVSDVQAAVAAAGRTEAEGRRQDAIELRQELAQLLAALQSAVLDRLEQTAATDAKTLRATLATGFDRVSASFGDSALKAIQGVLQKDADSRHGELAELQAELARSLASLASTVTKGTEAGVVQGDRMRVEMERAISELHGRVGRLLAEQDQVHASRIDQLRAELSGTLDDLDEMVGAALEAGVGSFEQRAVGLRSEVSSAMYEVQQLIIEAARADSELIDGAFAAAQRRIDEVAALARSVAAEQGELRSLVEQALRRR
jgi:hypothetical protein